MKYGGKEQYVRRHEYNDRTPFDTLHCVSRSVGVGPASVMVGNLVAGKRIAQAAGRDLGVIDDQDLVRKVA